MNPLMFFDYMFYIFAYICGNKLGQEATKEIKSIGVLSVFQILNLLTVSLFFVSDEFDEKLLLICFLSIAIFVLTFNCVRYYKVKTYEKLNKEWNNEVALLTKKKLPYIIIYGIFSIITFIWLSS